MESRHEQGAPGRSRSRQKKAKKRIRTLRRVLLFLTLLLAAFVGFAGIKVWNAWHQSYNPVEASDVDANDDQKAQLAPARKKGDEPFTVLLMGTDSRSEADRGRPDTIILAAANPKTQKVTLLSIPRDTYVEIAGKGKHDKINHAYNYGTGTMLKTVEELLDIPVDYYVMINFKGFEELIDEIGGIEIDVEKRMYYRSSDTYINLYPGRQVLNGEQALGYARFRRDAEGDFGRNRRQQQVLRALADQAVSLRNVDNVFAMLDILGKNIKHNIPPQDMTRMLSQFRNISGSDIESLTMEVTSTRMGPQNLWYNIVSEEERRRLHDELAQRLELAPPETEVASDLASTAGAAGDGVGAGSSGAAGAGAAPAASGAAPADAGKGAGWMERLRHWWDTLF